MKLAAAVIIAGTLLSIGFCMETSRKETAKQLQELIRFLLFAGQEIEIRGSILEDVFTKASSITQGATKELVSRMAKRMAEGGDFLQEWSNAVNEVYRKMGGQYKGNSGKLLVNGKNVQSPVKLLETGVRVIDTVNPIVEGGTGFIPGPFGTGKTVLQHAISKQAEADIVIIAACGERANEVVEIFTEFPELVDPHTGRKLMERTIIIANTSNMPVAAREASVYTAMSLAEYYRSMGLKVLLMADSTSRWAQALREMSNRMEELPGPDAFPMDISAIISNFYGRAGYVKLNNDETGSITFIGTVSPAGGNLKEPVTENTKKVARCFYALEQDRADKKRYPAVNPIDSYSKYIEYPEFEEYIKDHINDEWIGKVNELKTRLQRGKEIAEQINILGDDGVPVEYHVIFWKSELIDFVILQQDAFDEVDSVTPMERQEAILNMIIDICHTEFEFENFNEVMDYFKKMINVCKQMNYSKFKSEQYEGFQQQLKELIAERSVK